MTAIDRVFLNGRLWTGDEARPAGEALAVAGETIVAVGSTAHILALAPPNAQRIDFEGRRVLPGFIDAHWHFLPQSRTTFFMAGDMPEFQRRLAALAAQQAEPGWICDMGWAYSDFPDRVPHRRWIDDVVSDRPVWLVARDGHMALANELALQAAGISEHAEAPPLCRYARDAQGRLTGEVIGASEVMRINALVPALTAAQTDRRLRDIQDEAHSFGVTSVQNLDEALGEDLASLLRARSEGWLSLRVRQAHRLLAEPDPARLALLAERHERHASDTVFSFGGLKSWLDGTIDARTAFMREPLTDGSEPPAYWDPQQLADTVATMDRLGWQAMLHATGDAAIGQAIAAYEHAARVNAALGPRDRRHRIEHIDIPDADDLARCARAGIIASSQPNFAYPDDTVIDNYCSLLGAERSQRAQRYRSIDAAGVRQCFSSDYPVSSMNALAAMHTALTRTRRDRASAASWQPQERIGLEAALRHFTADGAYAAFEEHLKGRLSPGLLADMVVLSDDVFDDPERTLADAHVAMTISGGRVVHEGKRSAAHIRAGSPLHMSRTACPACRGFSLDPQALARRTAHRPGNGHAWQRRA